MTCEQRQADSETRLRRIGSHTFTGSEHEQEEQDATGHGKLTLKRTASSISRAFKDLKFMVTHGKKPQAESDDEAFARCPALMQSLFHKPQLQGLN